MIIPSNFISTQQLAKKFAAAAAVIIINFLFFC